MPWVDKEKCISCGICVRECPVNAVFMEEKSGTDEEKAAIDMDKCIHCGVCHSVCPENAVRHDSEKVDELVSFNVNKTMEFMEACALHLGDDGEKENCLNRMKKHFNREKLIAEKTLKELELL